PAVTFTITSNPTALTAGGSGYITVLARDASGNVCIGYQGTVVLGSSDPAGWLPTSYTFTANDYGEQYFTFFLKTAGRQQFYASVSADGVYGSSAPVTFSPAAPNHFTVSAPQYSASYYGFNVTVTAQDAYNNTTPNYAGSVHSTSSDGAPVLPADYTFTASDL